jgi:hypothetical protein
MLEASMTIPNITGVKFIKRATAIRGTIAFWALYFSILNAVPNPMAIIARTIIILERSLVKFQPTSTNILNLGSVGFSPTLVKDKDIKFSDVTKLKTVTDRVKRAPVMPAKRKLIYPMRVENSVLSNDVIFFY